MDATPSPALLAANRRLYELRARQSQHTEASLPCPVDKGTAEGGLSLTQRLTSLPSHLGWESEAATKAVRAALARTAAETKKSDSPTPAALVNGQSNEFGRDNPAGDHCYTVKYPEATRCQAAPTPKETIKHYPTLGIAALKAGEAPVYQVWLAGRFLDGSGRGWLSIEEVRRQLTGDGSLLQLFGWRRLRQVLGQGNGRYWTWDKEGGRLWLWGAARVAAGLGVERLEGRPVALPVTAVVGDIGVFKAHLYAAWHSGRKKANPMSRATQEKLSGLPGRTQRHYCRVARVKRQRNIAIGGQYTQEAAQECAWRRGRAMFEFHDAKGKQGRPGSRYLAWHLPATHIGPHQPASQGRQRKVNRKLQDLVINRARGNSSNKVDQRYWPDGAVAAKAYNRSPKVDAHWRTRPVGRRYQLWCVLPAG